jgi:hypothetical protein
MKADYNTKLDKNFEAFIQYRIEGKSFDEIAKELKTSKHTLIEWNKKEIVRSQINEGKILKMNTLLKAYKFDLNSRVKTYLELSKKINDELLSRDLIEISTDVLLKMSIANDNRIKEISSISYEVGKNEYIYNPKKFGDGFFEIKADE